MRYLDTVLIAALALGLASCATRNSKPSVSGPASYSQPMSGYGGAPDSFAGEPARAIWPQVVVHGSSTNFVYEPRVDSWDGRQVTARDAVALQNAGQSQPTFGVVTLQAITLVDKTTKNVSLAQIHILGGDFPSARSKNSECLRAVQETFPKELSGLSLDQLENDFVAAPQQFNGSAQSLNNSPPKIIFSTKPALLIYIDGPPAYRVVAGTGIERAVNSRALLLKDTSGRLYLHILDGYMTAPSLTGPWTVAQQAPQGASQAESQALQAATPADLLEGRTDPTNPPPHLTTATAPLIYTSTKPAELILFEGPPDFVPIPGTRLLYVENTTGNVFKSTADQQLYVLLSGRWFRGASPDGPWQFVLPDHLPPDFADIPDDSPKENVKASVPGTPQATEALIANSVPQSTKVPLTTPMQKPQIDGQPRLQPIAGTPLFYVANSGTPIIRVNEHSWYACQNGVWFTAASIDGTWTVATSVPGVIYSIPTTSPLHYLTYVQVYGATQQEVYEGYTPGYLGTDVEDGVVVYGTGYYYPPWIGADWYGWPCTWGFGWAPCWNPWDDWCFDFGFGWGCGFGPYAWGLCHPFGPWWGPGRFGRAFADSVAWRNSASTARNLYRHPGAFGSRSARSAVARSQLAGSFGRAYNSRTGALAAGQRAGVRNVYSGLAGQRPALQARGQFGQGRFSSFGAEARPAGMQYGPYSRSAAARPTTASGFARPGFYGRDFAGRSSGYYNAGGYSHSYGHGYGGGYSHGGGSWGGGGGGHGGGSWGGGGGHGGGGHGGGGGGGGHGGGGR